MRIELRPSRWLAASLAAIGVLGGAGLFLTDMPALAAAMLAPLCIAWGLHSAHRELRRAPSRLVLGGDGRVHVDGAVVDDARVRWQGPLTCFGWRSGSRRIRRVEWPDVLDAASRRELRLWTLAHRADARTAPVAP